MVTRYTYSDCFFQKGLDANWVLTSFVLCEIVTDFAGYRLPKDWDLNFEHVRMDCLSGSAAVTSLMPTLQPTAVSGGHPHRIVYSSLCADKMPYLGFLASVVKLR